MTGINRYLVTATEYAKYRMWRAVGPYSNWLEGRVNGDRETWLVTVFAERSEQFLDAARAAGVTVEEVAGAGDSETYLLRVGDPGTGWGEDLTSAPPPQPRPEENRPVGDIDDFQDRGEAARQAAGIDGTAGDAQDVPHRYQPDAAHTGCLLCGLAPTYRNHTQEEQP